MLLPLVRSLVFVALVSTAAAQSAGDIDQSVRIPSLAGIWVLNPALTVRPGEIGFSRDWARGGGPGEGGGRSGGGRGHRGGSASGGVDQPLMSRESADDSTRVQQLTDDARTPPSHITIVQNPNSVSIADDQGHSRTFHPTGSLEELTIGTVPLPTTARWDAGSLVVLYDVEQGRQLRYTYTPTTNPARLLVDIRFLERGREGDGVKLTYEPPDDARPRAVVAAAFDARCADASVSFSSRHHGVRRPGRASGCAPARIGAARAHDDRHGG